MSTTVERAPQRPAAPQPLGYDALLARIKEGQQHITDMIADATPEARGQAIERYRISLNDFLRETDKQPLSPLEKALYRIAILTERFRVDHATSPAKKLNRLRDIRSATSLQREKISFLLQANDKLPASQAKSVLSSFWADEESIFTAAFERNSSASLKDTYEEYHTGVLGPTAVEHTARHLPGWRARTELLDTDVKEAIDYVTTSENGNLFLMQIKTRSAEGAKMMELATFSYNQQPHNYEQDKMKFWRGIQTYLRRHPKDFPACVRALYVVLASREIDRHTGLPSQDLRDKIALALEKIDDNDVLAWRFSLASAPRD